MNTMTNKLTYLFAIGAVAGFVLAGCGDDDGVTDSGMLPTDGGGLDSGMMVDGGPPPTGPCTDMCTQLTTNCAGANAQYASMAECVAYCEGAGWPVGTEGEMAGNTISCRIYHGGAPAAGDPGMHCPHAGPSGAGVCGSPDFRTDMAAAYTRVDRMGMPAVSTALVSTASKNAYNDNNPTDDATLALAVTELIPNLGALHMALDDDLTTAGLTPCSMTTLIGTLPECVGQDVGPGVTVASLVIPDTLQVNPANPAGFPNGRKLTDPVIDVVLSVILLRLTAVCGAGTCGPTTLVGTNPMANDVAFLDAFPYLAAPRAP